MLRDTENNAHKQLALKTNAYYITSLKLLGYITQKDKT